MGEASYLFDFSGFVYFCGGKGPTSEICLIFQEHIYKAKIREEKKICVGNFSGFQAIK